jgi:hypothetical protein
MQLAMEELAAWYLAAMVAALIGMKLVGSLYVGQPSAASAKDRCVPALADPTTPRAHAARTRG